MQPISEEASTTSTSRKVLIAIDDNYACEKACDFALREFYRLVAFVIPTAGLPVDVGRFCHPHCRITMLVTCLHREEMLQG